MTGVSGSLLEQLSALLGPKGFTTDQADISPWLTDWRGRFHGAAAAMLSPANAEEVASVVRLAGQWGVALVPQGGNTSMVGGATPPADGSALILSLRRMNRIRSLDGEVAVAEAGVILSTLHETAATAGKRFPLSLGAKGSATIGGLVSTNAGGTQVLRFGTMRSLVLGLEAVLPDGSRYHGLAPLKKDNRGPDLKQLLIGAEGTLGIVTAASLKLYPAVRSRAVGWLGVASPQKALEALRIMERRSGEAIESFELLPESSMTAVIEHISGTRRPLAKAHAWHVLVEHVAGDTDADATETLTDLTQGVAAMGLIEDAIIATSEAQAEALWRIRDSISEAERKRGPAVQQDISVPVDVMPDFMVRAANVVQASFPGVHASSFGHLGDGNVHFHVSAPKGVDEQRWREEIGAPATRLVHDLVTAAGGSISAEHGIGEMKLAEFARLAEPGRLAALRALKAALDPKGIMNPGKLVPPADEQGSLAPRAPAS